MTVFAPEPGSAAGTPRRILMIAACPFPAPRGTPIRVYRIAESLVARGHSVDVATYHLGDTTRDTPFRVHRIARVPTYNRMDPGPSYQKLTIVDGLLAGRILQLAWSLRPDIIHAHHYEGLLTALPASRLLGVPLVFDSHVLLQGELDYYQLRGLGSARKNRIGRYLDRHLTRRADHVLVVTRDMRTQLLAERVIGPDRLTVAGNGVEEAFFAGKPGAFPADGLRRILFTGNLALYQGVDRLIEALALLARSRSDVRLVVATGSDRKAFEQLAAARGVLDRIDVLDASVEQLPDLIASADVALNPRTVCPGIPQKLLNYMAAGAAIVSFAGSAKHLRNEETALIAADDDVAAFSAAISRLLDDARLRARLGSEARLYARQFFSWNSCAGVIEEVYEQVLSRKRPRAPARAPDAIKAHASTGLEH